MQLNANRKRGGGGTLLLFRRVLGDGLNAGLSVMAADVAQMAAGVFRLCCRRSLIYAPLETGLLFIKFIIIYYITSLGLVSNSYHSF